VVETIPLTCRCGAVAGSLAALLLTACPSVEPDDADRGGELVDHDLWRVLSASEDPFDDRPEDVGCDDSAWGNELIGGEESLEIGTDSCAYLIVAQPSLALGLAGDIVHLRLWHYELNHFEPAEAHAAVSIAGEIVWEVRHDIPGGSGMDPPYWDAPSDFEIGDEVLFHLHNHGSNTWNFIELSAAPP
jgi:hypothetical protein